MARDGLSMRLEGGLNLDRILTKMAVTHQSATSKIVNQSLSSAATVLKKSIADKTPIAKKDTTGFKTESRNIKRGQLKSSLRSGLRQKRVKDRNTFVAGVWFNEGGAKDGFYARFLWGNHAPNAFKFSGGKTRWLASGISSAESKVKRKIGEQLAKKIAIYQQNMINTKLK